MQGMFTTKNFVALLYPLWGGGSTTYDCINER